MIRTSLLSAVLVVLALGAASSARADEARGYVPYDGWVRGDLAYHGFSWRNPEVAGTDSRRPDFTRWSSFDQYPLREHYPLYRLPERTCHGTVSNYVWPNQTDVHLTACGVPPIEELCPRRHHHHHCKHRCEPTLTNRAVVPTEFLRQAKSHDWTQSPTYPNTR